MAKDDNAPHITKTEYDKAMIIKGLDLLIATINRANARETNQEIRALREKQIEQVVIMKNTVITNMNKH